MNRVFLPLVLAMMFVAPSRADASVGLAGSSIAALLLAILMILLTAICVFIALKIFSCLKGGELASAWQIMAISFVILVIAEVVKLFALLSIADVSENVIMLIRLVGLCTVMIGVSRIRRVLS
jgi:FtsH-binding integral membrane protein